MFFRFLKRKEVKLLIHFDSRKDTSWPFSYHGGLLFSSLHLMLMCDNMKEGKAILKALIETTMTPSPKTNKQKGSTTAKLTSLLLYSRYAISHSFTHFLSHTPPFLVCAVVLEKEGYSVH